jgi:glycosyltransferase involved in cell wall biosynthesis
MKPILSIVIPTREGLEEDWFKQLLNIQGEVEFILVNPPQVYYSVTDNRLRQVISPLRGEIIQRMTGLLNATADYVLTINCDEYLHPQIAAITQAYFTKFPDSWVLRLSRKSYPFGEKEQLVKTWETIQDIDNNLTEIPIAPLENKFDWGCFIRSRKDHHGRHTENFDKKVWQTKLVHESLNEMINLIPILGPFKYIPFWCLDRLLGLYIQAKFFEKDKKIGHILPLPEQIRIEDNPPEFKRSGRFYVFAEIWLLRSFPQYGYLWNLIIHHLRSVPERLISSLTRKLTNQ